MMFETRGYMLDISRDRIPTMRTLRLVVDILARCRYNQFQLYMEHSFAYGGHEQVWEDADPLVPAEIAKLQAYCEMQGIELVPNQNTFGHMERWLTLPKYNPLAKFPKGGALTPWGTVKKFPTTLDPANPGSLALVEDLLSQLLPNFDSPLVNIGCDETFDLLGNGRSAAAVKEKGEGRVYLDFLLKVADLARARGRGNRRRSLRRFRRQ